MKRVGGLVVIGILLVACGYGWYFFYGPVRGLKITPQTKAATQESNLATSEEHDPVDQDVSIAEPTPPPIVEESPAPSPTIAVIPSQEEIEGFPAQITVRDGEQAFVAEYTGQFRRTKEFVLSIDVYDIASYVVEPTHGETLELLDGLLVDGKVKVYVIRFLNSLPGRPLMNDIYNDINTSFTDVDLEKLQENVDRFCLQFQDGSRRGDTVFMAWLPDGKVYSGFNTTDPLTLLAHDIPFARALWRNWSGPRRGDLRFNLVRNYATDAEP